MVRALVVGAVAVLVVLAGAGPAHAGKPGPPGSAERGQQAANAGSGGRAGAQESAAGRSQPGAQRTPKPAARPAAKPASATRPSPKSPQRPAASGNRPGRPHHGHPPQRSDRADGRVEVEGDRIEAAPEPVGVEPVQTQPAEEEPAVRPLSTGGVRARDLTPRFSRSTNGRPNATARYETAAPPAAPTLAAPGAPATTLAAGALDPRQVRPLWPGMLPSIDHPAFPGLLIGMLAAFAALACRGDRRDPKLNRSVIDDRGRGTSFR